MRNAFADELVKLATEDPRIVMLSGDIGNRLFDTYKALFPDRFLNCGVAEANMTGMAAGMALSGLRPITYTITPFVTTRCLEQIRVDICYHHAPVIIVGVGAGLSYHGLGATHHSCEDIAFLRVLPEMTVICPADAMEVRAALRAALKHHGPVYIRMGKKGEPVIHKQLPDFTIGKAIEIKAGADICILSTGNMLPNALGAVQILEQNNISARVFSFHTIKPLDTSLLQEVFAQYALVVSLEEHSLLGGLGSSISEWLTEHTPTHARLLKLGTPDAFSHKAGSQKYAQNQLGLDAESVVARIRQIFQK